MHCVGVDVSECPHACKPCMVGLNILRRLPTMHGWVDSTSACVRAMHGLDQPHDALCNSTCATTTRCEQRMRSRLVYEGAVREAVHIRDERVAPGDCQTAVVQHLEALEPRSSGLRHLQPMQEGPLASRGCCFDFGLQPCDVLGVVGVQPQASEWPRFVEFGEASFPSRLLLRPSRYLSPPGLLAVVPLVELGGVLPKRRSLALICAGHVQALVRVPGVTSHALCSMQRQRRERMPSMC